MVWFIVALVVLSGFLYAVFFGAPYVPAFKQDFDELFDLAGVKKGTELIDLGSGDGKVLLAAAQRGAQVTGYEINPVLWLISMWRLREFRGRARVKLGSMWRADLTKADVVYMYLHTKWMNKMERKLKSDMRKGSKVVSYVFAFTGLKQIAKTRNAQVYEL